MTPFNCFTEDVAEGRHLLATHQLVVALTNSAPSASNTQLSDITQISYTNCSTRNVTVTSSSQTAGVYSLVLQDLVLTATGGSVGPFRYIVLYNATASGSPLIAWSDLGSSVSILAAV